MGGARVTSAVQPRCTPPQTASIQNTSHSHPAPGPGWHQRRPGWSQCPPSSRCRGSPAPASGGSKVSGYNAGGQEPGPTGSQHTCWAQLRAAESAEARSAVAAAGRHTVDHQNCTAHGPGQQHADRTLWSLAAFGITSPPKSVIVGLSRSSYGREDGKGGQGASEQKQAVCMRFSSPQLNAEAK